MKKISKNRIISSVIFGLLLLVMTGCRSYKVPDDFNISFQFGTTDADMVTIDTYNHVMTLGLGMSSMKTVPLTLDDLIMEGIYKKMSEHGVRTWKEDKYIGNEQKETPNIQFSIKYTALGHTTIIQGDSTTYSYKKKDATKLMEFREYMINLIKGMEQYHELQS